MAIHSNTLPQKCSALTASSHTRTHANTHTLARQSSAMKFTTSASLLSAHACTHGYETMERCTTKTHYNYIPLTAPSVLFLFNANTSAQRQATLLWYFITRYTCQGGNDMNNTDNIKTSIHTTGTRFVMFLYAIFGLDVYSTMSLHDRLNRDIKLQL